MTLPIPPADALRRLLEHVQADDTDWLRARDRSGDLAWLRPLLPEGAADELGTRLAAGDLDWFRLRLAMLPELRAAGVDVAAYGIRPAAVASRPRPASTPAGAGGAAGRGPATNGRDPRRVGLWLFPILLVAGIVTAVILANARADDSDTTVPDLTVAAASDGSTAGGITIGSGDTASVPASTVEDTDAADTTPLTAPTVVRPTIGDLLVTFKAAGTFDTLTRAFAAADLTSALEGPGPVTVFAPTDQAFNSLPPGVLDALLKPQNKATLVKVLSYHVATGSLKADDVKDGALVTLEGSSLEALKTDGKLLVNGVAVTTADVATSNGMLHAIGGVLIPPTVDIPALLGDPIAATTATEGASATGDTAALASSAVSVPQGTNAAGDAVPESLTVYFGNGTATLDAAARTKIVTAAATLRSAATRAKVDVVGHASGTGDPTFNQQLSERRAAAVVDALRAELGDDAANYTFTASAKGDTETTGDAATSRRVTIEIRG